MFAERRRFVDLLNAVARLGWSHRVGQAGGIELCLFDQQNQIHQIFHAGVFTSQPWQGVGMKFFRELFFRRNCQKLCARNSREPKPVPA